MAPGLEGSSDPPATTGTGGATGTWQDPGSCCATLSTENPTQTGVGCLQRGRNTVAQRARSRIVPVIHSRAEPWSCCSCWALLGLTREQDQALAQLIVLGGRGQVWVFRLEKTEPLVYRK